MDSSLTPAAPEIATPTGTRICLLPALAAIHVTGADAAAFLHSQLSSDVKALAPNRGQYSSYNSPKGRMLATLIVWRQDDDYLLVAAADMAEAVRKRLTMFVLRSKAALAADPSPLAGIYGDGASAGAEALCGDRIAAWSGATCGSANVLALPDGRLLARFSTESGAASVPGAAEGDESAWKWLGIRAGVPWVTAATSDKLIAQSANWELVGGVDFHKGCYPGQEIVARMQYLGRLKERLRAFHSLQGAVSAGATLRQAGSDEAAGMVVNAAPAPGGGSDLLAVVKNTAFDTGTLNLAETPDGALTPLPLPYDVPALENVRVRL
jgi:folate-binding protein YgfZ